MTVLTQLPLDLTGAALTNRRVGERHNLVTVPGKTTRVLFPHFGGFYTTGLRLYDTNTGVTVNPTNYKLSYLYDGLLEITGQPVYGCIIITNPSVSNNLSLDYRPVGGHFGVSPEEVADILEQIEENNSDFSWDSIADKPKEFAVGAHNHEQFHVYNYQYPIAALVRLAQAVQTGNEAAITAERRYAEWRLSEGNSNAADIAQQLLDHMGNYNNPHSDDREAAGLGNVVNAGLADNQEMIAGVHPTKYATTRSLAVAVDAVAGTLLRAHVADRDNPHGTSYEDVDGLSIAQINELVTTNFLAADGIAYNSNLLNGRTYNQLFTEARADLPADAVTSGVFGKARLGSGTASASKMLDGSGAWSEMEERFTANSPSVNKVLYIQMQGNDANALAYIEATFTDIEEYPIGTVIVYDVNDQLVITAPLNQLSAAVREAGGWSQKL